MRYVSLRSVALLLVLFFVGGWGCAGGEEIDPVGECESPLDCGANETCDLTTNTCEPLRAANNSSNSTTPTNLGTPDTGFNPGTDAGDEDMAMEVCTPACDDDEVCMGGQCVSACPDGCANDQICTSDGCVYPDCTAVGDPCEADNGDQGDFLCLADESGDGECFSACSTSFEVDTCATGEYCFDVTDDGSFKACLPSTCDSSADCTDGTCIDFENDYATCFSSGGLAIGAPCNLENGDSCVGGAFCRLTDSATGDGVCSAICDPWAATSSCPAGEACGYFLTWRTGLCTDELDSFGTEPFEQCATPGDTCADATRCFDVGTADACFQYCRPGSNDCVGILPDGSDAVCNNYVFYGNRVIGLCDGPCAGDGDCPTGARCVAQACRRTCTDQTTAVADCCGGTTPCDAMCVNGLCE